MSDIDYYAGHDCPKAKNGEHSWVESDDGTGSVCEFCGAHR